MIRLRFFHRGLLLALVLGTLPHCSKAVHLVCKAGERRCQGQDLMRCKTDGSGFTRETTCTGGKRCNADKCACDTGKEDCKGKCIDLRADPTHCGSCNKACQPGETCDKGTCRSSCKASETECAGRCVALDKSDQHCGRCDNPCSTGQSCVGGACVLSCSEQKRNCNNACVDLQTDPRHCGACGAACPQGRICNDGKCVRCEGLTPTRCDNACVDLQTDPQHCGVCGRPCGGDLLCSSGQCGYKCDGTTPQHPQTQIGTPSAVGSGATTRTQRHEGQNDANDAIDPAGGNQKQR